MITEMSLVFDVEIVGELSIEKFENILQDHILKKLDSGVIIPEEFNEIGDWAIEVNSMSVTKGDSLMTEPKPVTAERIEEILAKAKKATPEEEWYELDILADSFIPRDAAFIAHARTDVPDLCAALLEANDVLVKTINSRNKFGDGLQEAALFGRILFYLREHGIIPKEGDDE